MVLEIYIIYSILDTCHHLFETILTLKHVGTFQCNNKLIIARTHWRVVFNISQVCIFFSL